MRLCRSGAALDLYTAGVPMLVRLALAWAINAAALWVADWLFDGVRIDGWKAYLIGSAVLGVANSVIKPVLAVLTLPLIVLTLGVFYLVINIAMVALAEWVAPRFSIDGFWTYVGAVVVIWLVNWVGHSAVDELEPRASASPI
jgi:putative membrane protein